MKTNLRNVITLIFLALLSTGAIAQKGVEDGSKFGHGEDSVNCRKNESLYRSYYDQNNYQMAIPFWRQNMQDCPLSSVNLYIRGEKMYKDLYIESKNEAYIDTVFQILDQKSKYFGHAAVNEARKATDLWDLNSDSPAFLKRSFDILNDVFNSAGTIVDPDAMVIFMAVNAKLFSMGELTNDVVINSYATLSKLIEARLARTPDDSRAAGVKSNLDIIFKTSGAATCEGLIPLFTPKVAANPKDGALLKQVITLLYDAGCTDQDLYFRSVEKLYALEKNSNSAYQLAEMYFQRGNMESAEKHYIEAAGMESDNLKKSSYYTKLATLKLEAKDFPKVREYARSAIAANSGNGAAYLLIGKAYGATKLGNDDFDNRAVYWIAVDYFLKAKNTDPALTDLANESISAYSKLFPSKEDCFFRGIIEEGATYSVGGWIGESTTIRFKRE